METHHVVMTALGIAGFIFQAIGQVVVITRSISKSHQELLTLIERVRAEGIAGDNQVRREVGEALQALRNKIHEIETWSRDNFAKKDSFQAVISELKDMLRALSDAVDRRLDRTDQKLDTLQERVLGA